MVTVQNVQVISGKVNEVEMYSNEPNLQKQITKLYIIIYSSCLSQID
jgi:hypothetical protein